MMLMHIMAGFSGFQDYCSMTKSIKRQRVAEHKESLLGNTHKQHAHTLGCCGLGHKGELDEPRSTYDADQVFHRYGFTDFCMVGPSLHCPRVRGPNLFEQTRPNQGRQGFTTYSNFRGPWFWAYRDGEGFPGGIYRLGSRLGVFASATRLRGRHHRSCGSWLAIHEGYRYEVKADLAKRLLLPKSRQLSFPIILIYYVKLLVKVGCENAVIT